MKADVDYRVVPAGDESLLFLTGNHRAFRVDRDLGERLRTGVDRLTGPERAEWDRLAGLGLRSAENPHVLRDSGFTDGADLAVNINLTNVCNLSCTYCFADGGDYGRITSAMAHQSVDHIFAFIDANLTPSRSVRLEFFGGEPLANFPVIKEICARADAYAAEHGVRFVHRISTNLTLLPKGVLELFARHRFIVSVSIDGGRQVQDANRPSKNGRGSYDRVMTAVRKVRAAGEDITLVARMTVAQAEPTLVDNMRQLYDLNIFDYFQIYPGVFPATDQTPEGIREGIPQPPPAPVDPRRLLSLTPVNTGRKSGGCGSGSGGFHDADRYVNFFLQDGMVEQFRDFLRVYPTLFRPDNRFKGVLEYERQVQLVVEGGLALSFCSGGRTYYTHSPDESITSCHRLVGDPSFDVGTGPEGITAAPQEWRLPVDNHPVCGRCWARYLCGGGCKQENFVASGDVNVLNDESCRYQLLLAEEVLRMLARSDQDYLDRRRQPLDDMFVSCGRPVVGNGRTEPEPPRQRELVHFRPLGAAVSRPADRAGAVPIGAPSP